MKTNKVLLPGMLASMMFAACANEEMIPQQNAGEPVQDLGSRPYVGVVDLNFGSQSATRADMGANFNDIEWTSVDKIGARIIDTRNTSGLKDCHAAHNYTVSEYAWSNYRYDFNGGKWTSDALMVEGNYMFYAPYEPTALYRTPLQVKFPTVQKVSGLTAIEDYEEGGVGGNTSAIENFYANKEGQTVVVGHTFLDSKENDGTKVTPQMSHLYAYPLITLVNEYKVPVMVVDEKTGNLVQKLDDKSNPVYEGKPITIDQITIESTNIYANYKVNQTSLAKALSVDVEKVDLNGDGDTADKNECAGIDYGFDKENFVTEGVKTGWYLKNAYTAKLLDVVDTKPEEGEVDPDGKIVIELDESLTIPAGFGVKLNVVMPAANYMVDNFKVNVRIVTVEDGKTVYKKFDKNSFQLTGDGVKVDEFAYAISKQIPSEEYNFKANGTTEAKKSWGTLATFPLDGNLIDYTAQIIDPAGLKNNEQFYGWMESIKDNSTSKYEKVFETIGGVETEVNNPDAARKGDFRLASDHTLVFNTELVEKVNEYLNDAKAKVYFVSDLDVVGSDDAKKPLVINGAKYPKFSGKLTIKEGYVTLNGVEVGELVVEGGNVSLTGSTNIGKISEINGDVTLDGATLTVDDTTKDKNLKFKGTANLKNVTIKNGPAVFEKAATIDGGTYGAVEFKNGGSLAGNISATGEATVSNGEIVAGNAAGWATVNLYGGNLKITNKDYKPTVNVGRTYEKNEQKGQLTAAAEGLVLPKVTMNTENSKFIVSNNVELTAFTWTKGSVENNATLKHNVTVAEGNTYTHNAEAVIDGTLTNNGTVYNNGKLALTNNKDVIVGAGGFTKTTINGGTGRIDNTALGYITGTITEQTIFVKTGAFSDDAAWKDADYTNSKINTFYVDGKWTVTNDVTVPAKNFEFVSGLDLGAATLNMASATSVKIMANQTWKGLDADVSEITNATITFGSYKNDANETVYYTLNTTDINMGTAYSTAVATVMAEGGNIKLGADVDIDATLTIAAGKVANIDMNGKTLTWNNETGSSAYGIMNSGKLTLSNGTFIGEGTSFAPCLYTNGETVLNNCKMISKNSNAVKMDGAGKLTINGGYYESQNATGQALRVGTFGAANASAWNLTINGGEFVGTWAGLYIVSNYKSLPVEGSATIKNATFKGNKSVVDSGVAGSDIVFDMVKNVTIENCTFKTESMHSETTGKSVINGTTIQDNTADVYNALFKK